MRNLKARKVLMATVSLLVIFSFNSCAKEGNTGEEQKFVDGTTMVFPAIENEDHTDNFSPINDFTYDTPVFGEFDDLDSLATLEGANETELSMDVDDGNKGVMQNEETENKDDENKRQKKEIISLVKKCVKNAVNNDESDVYKYASDGATIHIGVETDGVFNAGFMNTFMTKSLAAGELELTLDSISLQVKSIKFTPDDKTKYKGFKYVNKDIPEETSVPEENPEETAEPVE